jgi:hypothetical protein
MTNRDIILTACKIALYTVPAVFIVSKIIAIIQSINL